MEEDGEFGECEPNKQEDLKLTEAENVIIVLRLKKNSLFLAVLVCPRSFWHSCHQTLTVSCAKCPHCRAIGAMVKEGTDEIAQCANTVCVDTVNSGGVT